MHRDLFNCGFFSLRQSFSLRPLQVVLPSREDQDRPVMDIDLHLPFLLLSHAALLQVILGPHGTVFRGAASATKENCPAPSGALLPPSGAEAGVLLHRLGQTHPGCRESVAVPAGQSAGGFRVASRPKKGCKALIRNIFNVGDGTYILKISFKVNF